MVNRNLIRSLESDDTLVAQIDDIASGTEDSWLDSIELEESIEINKIVEGRILRMDEEFVLIDIGGKSEGSVARDEWDEDEDPPEVGAIVRVLVEDVEDEFGRTDDPHGMVALSKRKARKIDDWERTMESIAEGQVVKGEVTRKIKGGLLVDIGVNVFLPASQVDIRRPHDIADYIGRTVECEVLKIDAERRNIVVSRRSLIERKRKSDRESLLKELQVGQTRKGVVKNIADFGAFVDLGGIDGLLHITDMSWGRIGHPTEMVNIDDEIEVQILNIDHEREKIALGLKQLTPSPWDGVEEKYPVGSKVKGSVVNVMSYGAFVKLEEGIEGLVHISEMSWTKRISHPSELVNIQDEIEVVILGINKEKQEISLGMKQTQSNPWENIKDRYPVDSVIDGKVRNLTNYGAFVELEEGIDGLLHVSDMSWTRKIGHPSEMLEKGQEVRCKVLSIDEDRRRIALGLKQLDSDPWATTIPEKYQPNQLVTGKVTKITNFGVFVGLEDGLEGLLHISELSDDKVENPENVVKVGEEIEVKILRVDTEDRKIGLSRKRVQWAEDEAPQGSDSGDSRGGGMSGELKGGLGSSGPLFNMPAEEAAQEQPPQAEAAAEEPAAEESAEAQAEEPSEEDKQD